MTVCTPQRTISLLIQRHTNKQEIDEEEEKKHGDIICQGLTTAKNEKKK